MAHLTLKDVTKIYDGDVLAVEQADFQIPDESFTVLVGPSGCGKSTLLRMIAGLEEITEGDIYIDDERINDIPPKDRDIAMVFQNYALYPHMTVYKNMAFGLKLRKYPKAEIEARVKEAAEILSISHLLNRKPKHLSGGERQRVAVGRAIVRHPKVFLFDEPLSNLDAKLRVQMRMEISRLHDRLNATMVYVTHDQVEAMTMGDQIVVLNEGKIQQIADPGTLYHKPANQFVGGFIGTPPMNFIETGIVNNGGAPMLRFETFKVELNDRLQSALGKLAGDSVTLGIRPEDIHIGENGSNSVGTQVELVEPLGNHALLYLRTEKNSFVAQSDLANVPQHNAQLTVGFDMEKAHLFHPETGESLTVSRHD
ncbi:MAG: sn-glycerol-3-phosphate ABC transporter ATP-binding protein UgpC [Candidatus Poribacteria bacterium]|nr:sn-glycerol-3-phosphate ABC transporter ATP-binding protein UgpC [Candidatus Poribacteria bacterium]